MIIPRRLFGYALAFLFLAAVPATPGGAQTADWAGGDEDEPSDLLQFGKANRVAGRLHGISPDGVITMKVPGLKNDLRLEIKEARIVTFAAAEEVPEGARGDRVVLSNGDSLGGAIREITAETVTLCESMSVAPPSSVTVRVTV